MAGSFFWLELAGDRIGNQESASYTNITKEGLRLKIRQKIFQAIVRMLA